MRTTSRRVSLRHAGLVAAALAVPAAAFAQQPAGLRPDGDPVTITGVCDASAIVSVPGSDPPAWLVANDDDETLALVTSDGRARPLAGDNLRGALRLDDAALDAERPAGAPHRDVVRRGSADLEGAAWLGDRLYLIASHGRNSEGERRPRRERLIAVSVTTGADGVTIAHAEPMARYAHMLADLARQPLLRAAIDTGDAPRPDLAAERAGLNIEGLAAGSDGASLLIGFRNPLAPDGRAILLPLLNPAELRPGAAAGSARFGDPILLDLGRRGIRSIEYVPRRRAYLVVAGPPGTETDFALYAWAGPGGAAPARLAGDAAILGPAGDPFRPEGLAVSADGARAILVSDDGDRMVGQTPCKDAKPESLRSFRIMRLVLE